MLYVCVAPKRTRCELHEEKATQNETDAGRLAGNAGSHLHLAGAPGVLHLDPLAVGHAGMVVRRTDARLLLWRMQAREVSVPCLVGASAQLK